MTAPSGQGAIAAEQLEARSLLARRLAIATLTPVALLVALGLILTRELVQLSASVRLVDHSDQVLLTAHDTLRQIIDQETGMRGFLLARDQTFLEPLERAHPDESFARLHDLVSDDSAQRARFDAAHAQYTLWRRSITDVLLMHEGDATSTVAVLRSRKATMDGIRDEMRQAIDVEDALRRARVTEFESSTSTTKTVCLALFGASTLLLAFLSRRQLGSISDTFVAATDLATKARETVETETWIRAGYAKLTNVLQGERSLEQLGGDSLGVLGAHAHAEVGAFFTLEGGLWRRRAGFGLDSRAAGADSFALGEGLVGRVAAEGKLTHLRDVPADFLTVRSGTGEVAPVEVVLVPARLDGVTNAVIEFAFLHAVNARTIELLERVGDSLGLAVRSSEYKQQLRTLLEESRRQGEQLQTQREELRVTNEELEGHASALRLTQRQLETQQAELEVTNDHLVEQSRVLELRNRELAEKQAEVARKSGEVEKASQYKSEFLSNMSHELRTPLNSSLILAKLLADNGEGNLTDEQVKFAETIYSAGNDLLTLINDILDLSKIEAGKMDLHAASVAIDRIRANLLRTFEPIAGEKGLHFEVSVDPTAPTAIDTDAQRLEQVLKNLVSNALKFTARGEVVVAIAAVEDKVTFTVSDTGIGIADGQREIIFDAFRQADGTTNRKFGGTGLGLSISRELARLLGGEICVQSVPGVGSTFTLSLPRVYPDTPAATRPHIASAQGKPVDSTPSPPSVASGEP
ncbi:MAG: ATP-binding protein, partial [Polyangiales bacterium]